jgi:hypothetical protein
MQVPLDPEPCPKDCESLSHLLWRCVLYLQEGGLCTAAVLSGGALCTGLHHLDQGLALRNCRCPLRLWRLQMLTADLSCRQGQLTLATANGARGRSFISLYFLEPFSPFQFLHLGKVLSSSVLLCFWSGSHGSWARGSYSVGSRPLWLLEVIFQQRLEVSCMGMSRGSLGLSLIGIFHRDTLLSLVLFVFCGGK